MFNSINCKKMNTIANFKNSVIALAIGLAVVSCGGRGGNQQSGAETSEGAKVETPTKTGGGTISKTTKSEDYTTGALAKMSSLGKTEKDKRLITVGGGSNQTVYIVYTFENGQCTDKSEYKFFTKGQERMFDAVKSLATEANAADTWVRTSYGSEDGDWQSWYNTAKKTESNLSWVLE